MIQKVFNKVIESDGKKPVSKAMVEVGYPTTTATNPNTTATTVTTNAISTTTPITTPICIFISRTIGGENDAICELLFIR